MAPAGLPGGFLIRAHVLWRQFGSVGLDNESLAPIAAIATSSCPECGVRGTPCPACRLRSIITPNFRRARVRLARLAVSSPRKRNRCPGRDEFAVLGTRAQAIRRAISVLPPNRDDSRSIVTRAMTSAREAVESPASFTPGRTFASTGP